MPVIRSKSDQEFRDGADRVPGVFFEFPLEDQDAKTRAGQSDLQDPQRRN